MIKGFQERGALSEEPNKISSFTLLDSLRFLDSTVRLVYWIGYLLLQSYVVPVSLGVGMAGLGQVFGLVLLFFIFGNALQVCRPGIL